MGLNVTIPDSIPNDPTPSAPEPSSAGTEIHVPNTPQDLSSGTPGTQATPTPQELVDLDKHERFRWQNREWDRKELQDGYLRQQDYSRKTAELRENRKYADNFRHDLQKVVSDRTLVDEFKRVYPKEWHDHIDGILTMLDERATSTGQASGTANAIPSQPADLSRQIERTLQSQIKPLLSWKEEMETKAKETQKQANLATLNQWEEELQKKYPFADMEKVEARAEILIAQDPDFRLDKGKFEKLCKDAHGESEKRYAEYVRQNNSKQQAASERAKDIGPGGATPGTPPQAMNMKEARKALFESLER